MIKYLLSLLLLMVTSAVLAQQKSVIKIIKSSSLQNAKINGIDVLKVYDVIFEQDFSTLQSDSAYFNQKANTFDAFGHVVITQGDTMHIYSDKLNYAGNTKIAILTDNVKMVDKDAVLTTNYLTYNTATRIGTYTGGGKLVNKDNILTSTNGYYFAHTRDSYFRYNVRLVTPDALTVTDTMRYNSGTKIAYFYGPTNIYGKKKGKDNDTLYTENGSYNTNTEQAFFGKKNLYRQNTKTLTGDSLFYDRKKGFGHAINHIIFNDKEQKMTLKGDLADYFKSIEKTVVTKNAYAVIVTEQKDTSKNDSLAHKITPADTAKKVVSDLVKLAPAKVIGASGADQNKAKPVVQKSPAKPTLKPLAAKSPSSSKSDTSKASKKGGQLAMIKLPIDSSFHKKDTARMKQDSIFISADTLVTQIVTYKEQKDLQEKMRLAHIKDTSVHPLSVVIKGPVKYIEQTPPKMLPDTSVFHRHIFDGIKTKEYVTKKTTKKPAIKNNNAAAGADLSAQPVKKLSKQDSIRLSKQVDSVFLTRKVTLQDTARVRILSAFHHVKLFKSDLQGIADSTFYSAADSTIRLYTNPLVWTQGSQLAADTINLQMRDKKLNNMELYPNAFIVNIEKDDSLHFNQIAGKRMRGFFKNDKLESMFVFGNAETIYFARDSAKKQVTEMQRSLSSRIHIRFKDGKVSAMTFSAKPEHRYAPLNKFTEEDKTLKGFTWKPKERPVSKESILPSYHKKSADSKSKINKPPGKRKSTDKNPPGKNQPVIRPVGDTSNNKNGKGIILPLKTDSLQKKLDTLKKVIDTAKLKKALVKPLE